MWANHLPPLHALAVISTEADGGRIPLSHCIDCRTCIEAPSRDKGRGLDISGGAIKVPLLVGRACGRARPGADPVSWRVERPRISGLGLDGFFSLGQTLVSVPSDGRERNLGWIAVRHLSRWIRQGVVGWNLHTDVFRNRSRFGRGLRKQDWEPDPCWRVVGPQLMGPNPTRRDRCIRTRCRTGSRPVIRFTCSAPLGFWVCAWSGRGLALV